MLTVKQTAHSTRGVLFLCVLWQARKLTHWDRQTTYGSSWGVVSGSCSMWSTSGRRGLGDTCLHASTQCHACQACWFTPKTTSPAGGVLQMLRKHYLTLRLVSYLYTFVSTVFLTPKVTTNSCCVSSDDHEVENANPTGLWHSFSPPHHHQCTRGTVASTMQTTHALQSALKQQFGLFFLKQGYDSEVGRRCSGIP